MPLKKTVAVIYGGDSEEWIISEKSAATVYKNLSTEKYAPFMVRIQHNEWSVEMDGRAPIPIDRKDFSFIYEEKKIRFEYAFIEIHGTPGEDGKLQGYFDMIGIPYSTCGQLAAAVTFNKSACIALLKHHGIPCSNSVLLRKHQPWNIQHVLSQISLPCFVKPNSGGSSFGISKVSEENKLTAAIEKAFQYDTEVMVEELMVGREVTNGIHMHQGKVIAMPITEIISNNDFFDFEAKYEGASKEITPADLSAELTNKVQEISTSIYEKLDLKGLVRIDYILVDNIPHVIEVNITPGLSAESLIPQQATAMQINLGTLFDRVIQSTC